MKPVASPNATFQSWLEDLCRHLGNGISDWSTLILPLFPCPLQEKTIFKAKRYRIWGLQAREGGLWPWAQPGSGWACPLFLDKWICLGYWLCYSLSVHERVTNSDTLTAFPPTSAILRLFRTLRQLLYQRNSAAKAAQQKLLHWNRWVGYEYCKRKLHQRDLSKNWLRKRAGDALHQCLAMLFTKSGLWKDYASIPEPREQNLRDHRGVSHVSCRN